VFVAGLSGEDAPDWGGAKARLSEDTASVSGGGAFVVFMSDRSLTGFDNRDVVSGRPDEEVFEYDAATGGLSCVSCDPTGGRPSGVEYRRLDSGLAGGAKVWNPEVWLSGSVPGWQAFTLGTARYQSRFLSGSGRVFFNSSDALVPGDVDGVEDVYEFDPVGVAGCSTSSGTFGVVSGGCVSLVSSGTAVGESGFLDASESGDDVFFLTGEKLVEGDVDTALDVYDAHVCSGAVPCLSAVVSPPACGTADACRAPSTEQPAIFGAPASATFSGAGNSSPVTPVKKRVVLTRAQKLKHALTLCRRDRKHKRRVVCERRARKAFGARVVKGRGR